MPTPLRVNRDLALRDRLADAVVRALGDASGLVALQADPLGDDVPRDETAATRERLRRGAAVARAAADAQLEALAPLERALVQAALLFRAELFFEVHEVLEVVWRTLAGGRRIFVQGLIQVAVGFHHLAHDNPSGAAALFAAGRAKLTAQPSERNDVDVDALLAGLRAWESAAAAGAWDDAAELPAFVVRLSDGRRFG